MILDWLAQYSGLLNAFAKTGYFLLWGLFLQLMFLMFRRKRRTQLLINRGKQKDMEALCIISNMSAQPVFVEYILAELETSQGTVMLDVTDQDREYDAADETAADTTSQPLRNGPLGSSEFLHIGSFAQLVASLAQAGDIALQPGGRPAGDVKLHFLTVRLIGTYGTEDRLIGAKRRFALVDTGAGYSPVPLGADATQLSSRKQRRQLQQLAESFMEQDRHVA